jgi:hypothetical protein
MKSNYKSYTKQVAELSEDYLMYLFDNEAMRQKDKITESEKLDGYVDLFLLYEPTLTPSIAQEKRELFVKKCQTIFSDATRRALHDSRYFTSPIEYDEFNKLTDEEQKRYYKYRNLLKEIRLYNKKEEIPLEKTEDYAIADWRIQNHLRFNKYLEKLENSSKK